VCLGRSEVDGPVHPLSPSICSHHPTPQHCLPFEFPLLGKVVLIELPEFRAGRATATGDSNSVGEEFKLDSERELVNKEKNMVLTRGDIC
jgi:hypothetical protein